MFPAIGHLGGREILRATGVNKALGFTFALRMTGRDVL
jgi:hypothetical protein